jgi:MoxR-like ATPase
MKGGNNRTVLTSATLSPAVIGDALRSTGYLPSEGLSTVVFLATAMDRPLLLRGEPGAGKTSLAEARAIAAAELIRLQCYEGIEASQALYDWDFARRSCTSGRSRRPPETILM